MLRIPLPAPPLEAEAELEFCRGSVVGMPHGLTLSGLLVDSVSHSLPDVLYFLLRTTAGSGCWGMCWEGRCPHPGVASIPTEVMGIDTRRVKGPAVSQGRGRCWLSPSQADSIMVHSVSLCSDHSLTHDPGTENILREIAIWWLGWETDFPDFCQDPHFNFFSGSQNCVARSGPTP